MNPPKTIIQTEVFQSHSVYELEHKLNEFLHKLDSNDVIDIKMSHGLATSDPAKRENVFSTIVMVVYKKHI